MIGHLMYAMRGTRLDLSISLSVLSRYQSCASERLWIALKRILRYVKGTINLKLYSREAKTKLYCGYVDADWAGDITDRKSTAGYTFLIYGCCVVWTTKKQNTISLSSTEAEYIALSMATS